MGEQGASSNSSGWTGIDKSGSRLQTTSSSKCFSGTRATSAPTWFWPGLTARAVTFTPYTANGSGMLAAMAVLETGWKPGMDEEGAKKLVRDAITAGIINDMGSGSNVDIAVIKPGDDI